MPDHPKRKLSAILFTDIVGYSAMMQENEAKGLKVVNRFRELLESFVPKHNGELVQYYGDGSLSIFESSIDAMHCAKTIQEKSQIPITVPLKMGLHVGDIVFQDGTIYGDGVNIASRIESLGIAKSILFSERMILDLKSHPELTWTSLGKFHFKNIENPMEVCALTMEGLEVPNPDQIDGKLESSGSAVNRNQDDLKIRSDSGILANDIFIDTICERLAKYNPNLDKELNKEALVIPAIKEEIVLCFPEPMSEQFKILFTKNEEMESPHIMETFSKFRFLQLLNSYLSTIQFICYVMLSQLWDEKLENPTIKLSNSLKEKLYQLFQNNEFEIKYLDFVAMLQDITDLFDKHSITYFIDELSEVKLEALSNPKMNAAYLFFREWIENSNLSGIDEKQYEKLCLLGEEHLGVVINEFAFMINYKLASVINPIDIGDLQLEPKYKNRNSRFNANLSEAEIASTAYEDNIMFFKLSNKEIESYLGLSPFYIDGFSDANEVASDLHQFGFAEEEKYFYSSLKSMQENIEITGHRDLPKIHTQFNQLKATLLDLEISDLTNHFSKRKPISRFLKKR